MANCRLPNAPGNSNPSTPSTSILTASASSAPKGFRIYLNGHEIAAYGWWQDKSHYAPWSAVSPKHLKTGTNTIAVYRNIAYDDSAKAPYGQVDCFIEGLKLSDLE